MAEGKRGGTVNVTVNATFIRSGTQDKTPDAVAYAFSSGGKLLGQKPLNEKGSASISIPGTSEAASVRVLVGPSVEQEEGLVGELMRRGAAEQMLRVEAGTASAVAQLEITPTVWQCWLRGLCVVRGTLLKRSTSGGVSIDLPVCNATVEIYEVDPIPVILQRIPDEILAQIQQIIVGPGPVEVPVAPRPPQLSDFAAAAVRSSFGRSSDASAAQYSLVSAASAASDTIDIPDDVRTTALRAGTHELRQLLVDRADLIRPILCRYFPWLVRMDLIGTTTTNECGHFQRLIFRGCNNSDQPDLYFKAKQRLFGFFDVTIYAPTPVSCYTYWNYACGTEVTLYTTHPLAITCPPCPPVIGPDNWVLMMAIGNLPLSRIRGTGQTLQPTTNSSNIGLTDSDAPFGGTLRYRIEFDNSLRDTLNVKYYRVSYRQGTSGSWIPMTAECHRHYSHMVLGELVLEVYPLGPTVVGTTANLFEIPPALPPIGQWSFPDLTEDLTNAKFITTDLGPLAAPGVAWAEAGTYEVMVELFDASGNSVDLTAKGIKFVVPTSTDLSGTINTVDASTLGLVSGNTFVMTVHVDNSRCSADIQAPTIGATSADPCCGVLHYTSDASVTMAWDATHPNRFATYSFGVVRGVQPVFGQSGAVGGGAFSTTQTVATLMTTNPAPGCDPGGCHVAGFSENVYVAATATDGLSRLSQYDASAVRAFVLAPQGM